ncbi:MAG: metal-dependent hydrolase [Candidatus Thorarchaeota archaeon]|nr:metal-dependent hydrolase [Candidatus Thorarchaeota archaeon]
MPDLTTHLLFGAAVGIALGKEKNKSQFMMILLGSILIDIERPLTWILNNTDLSWINLSGGFHSILGMVILVFFASACFNHESKAFKTNFGLLLLGSITHLILDMTMWPWEELGIYLLYPLRIPFSFHIFWPEFVWYPLLGSIALVSVIVLKQFVRRISNRENTKGFSIEQDRTPRV